MLEKTELNAGAWPIWQYRKIVPNREAQKIVVIMGSSG
jgi:hypothetical protein